MKVLLRAKHINLKTGIIFLSLALFFFFITNSFKKNKSKDISDFVVQVAKVGAAIKSKVRLFGDFMSSWVVASPSNTARGYN